MVAKIRKTTIKIAAAVLCVSLILFSITIIIPYFKMMKKANADGETIELPRYIYDTSIFECTLGTGSEIALPKAEIEDTLSKSTLRADAVLTVYHNDIVLTGYDKVSDYADAFIFSQDGTYKFVYSHKDNEKTPSETYVIEASNTAPIITETVRVPYIIATGTALINPNINFSFNGADIDKKVNLYTPDGQGYVFSNNVAEDSGLYEIESRVAVNGKVYRYVKQIYAYGTNTLFTGKTSVYYGAPSFEDELRNMKSATKTSDTLVWKDGLNVSFAKGDVFTYEKAIDLSKIGENEKIFEFFVKPTGVIEVQFYVELVDVNNPDNVLSVRFCSVPRQVGSTSYRTYVSAAATGIGQAYAGYYEQGTGKPLYINRLSGGTYTSVDISGLKDTDLYYPLSFAYDEQSKQVKIGYSNRDVSMVVADMDDTETYFDNVWDNKTRIAGGRHGFFDDAWEGFSSDKVYVRMYVEGGYSGTMSTTITKIGNQDLEPDFSEYFPEKTLQYVSKWKVEKDVDLPYYGDIEFESDLENAKSYTDKTGADKLTWTQGINVVFDKGYTFNYDGLIDLSELGATEKLFKIYLAPTGTQNINIYVDLIDENDENNVLSVRFASVLADTNKWRVVATTSALKIGQPYTGYHSSNNALYLNRINGGSYTSTDITGLDTSLYYPLSFAYDETTKQVLTPYFDRDVMNVVADLDDTTTHFATVWNGSTKIDGGQTGYFATAWEGFSTDKVRMRVRIDGNYEEPISAVITKIGKEDLSEFVAERSDADYEKGSFVFNGDIAPYYGDIKFESDLENAKSYTDKTGADKLTWTQGINVVFDKGYTFNYDGLIDLSELGATEKLFKIYLAPTGTQNINIYVDLIDENDENNVLSVRFTSFLADTNKWRVYVNAAATGIGQPYTGRYSDGILHFNRTNGGSYTSTDITGLDTALYYPLSFAYDETTKQILTPYFDRDVMNVVADLDDTTTYFATVWNGGTKVEGGQTGYFATAWEGFSTDRVRMCVRIDGNYEEPISAVITKIGAAHLEYAGESERLMKSDAIKIDTNGYDIDSLPDAIVGREYKLFDVQSKDISGRCLKIITKIYYGNNRTIQIANNGVSFIPPKVGKYTVLCTAQDRYGYTMTTEYVVYANDSQDVNDLCIVLNNNSDTCTTGLNYALPSYSVKNSLGQCTVRIEACYNNEFYESIDIEEMSFVPRINGAYAIKYFGVDYCGRETESVFNLTAVAQNEPIFVNNINLPSALVSGWTYELPELYAVDYGFDSSQNIKANIIITDDGGTRTLNGNVYVPNVNATKDVSIKYVVSGKNGSAEKNYTVRVQKTVKNGQIDVKEYFLVENTNISVDGQGVKAIATQNGGKVSFVNPLVCGKTGLKFEFKVLGGENDFEALNIYLADSVNRDIKTKITLFKGDDSESLDNEYTTMKINDGKLIYRVPGSFLSGKSYELSYDDVIRQIQATNGVNVRVETTADGEPFSGFPSKKVILTFEFAGKGAGSAGLTITKLNNQKLNNTVITDTVAPQIAINGEYGGINAVNSETVVLSAIGGDVLSQNTSITVSVANGNKTVVSVDGISLNKVDASRTYVFIPTEFGVYRVSFYATDDAGKTAQISYNIVVADNQGPTIITESEDLITVELKNGKATTLLPHIVVFDNGGGQCKVVWNMKNQNGVMERITTEEITFTRKGTYTLYADAYDENGNLSVKVFTVKVI